MSLLTITDLHASIQSKEILKGIDLTIKPGEIHVIMGPNGAGKSTLANVLMGHPSYEVTKGQVTFDGENLLELKVDERSRAGLFLSFQYPQEVSGVSVESFLRQALKERSPIPPSPIKLKRKLTKVMDQLEMKSDYLERYLNEGFSGGEKKKNEILQMAALSPKLAILDETDSGLDIDAIKAVYQNIESLLGEDKSILIITHYNKILDYISPDVVHVLVDGKIVHSGDVELAKKIDQVGYEVYRKGVV